MSVEYKVVGWTRDKKIYDWVLAGGVVAYLVGFIAVGAVTHPQATVETLLIRALGTVAFLLLHVTLAIGPLARLDRRFLPLLYNRRHLGVTVFLLAAGHGVFSLIQFHTQGDRNPLVSVLVSNGSYASISQFPFQVLGLVALVILFLMAATSHDFWLTNLTAPAWKALHMSVYVAYVLLVGHVALGALQDERSGLLTAVLVVGAALLCTLHLASCFADPVTRSLLSVHPAEDGFVETCSVSDIPMNRARIAHLSGERVAIFRYSADGEERIAAVSNVCRHQNGPLGEGKVIDGCITCPWHGYQYRPEDGCSPAPFTETIPTFRVRLFKETSNESDDRGAKEDLKVWVHPTPLPPGTPSAPAVIHADDADGQVQTAAGELP